MSDLLKSNGEGTENVINLTALRAQSHAFLASSETPASVIPASQPATTIDVPTIPSQTNLTRAPLQSTVTVTEQPAPGQAKPPVVPGQQSVPVETPALAPTVINLPDDHLVEVIIDGQKQVMPWGQARSAVMLKSKFTKEMQQLRAKESQLTQLTERASQAEKMERLLTNPDLFLQYAERNPVLADRLAKRYGTSVAAIAANAQPAPQSLPPSANHDEIVNFGDLDQRQRELEARLAQSFNSSLEERVAATVDQKVAAATQALEDAKQISHINTQINDTINGILTANPVLKAIPNIALALRQEVQALQPRSAEEMFEAFDLVAKGIVEEIDAVNNQRRTVALIAKQEMVDSGVEPPKGQAPNTTIVNQTPSYINPRTGKFDFNLMKAFGRDVMNRQ